jgi:hypothetical protein
MLQKHDDLENGVEAEEQHKVVHCRTAAVEEWLALAAGIPIP